MNKYELTVVLEGKSGAAKKKKMVEMLEKVMEPFKGKITTTVDWGVKKLAYKIAKSETGLFTFFELDLDPSGVKALNDKLRTDSDIIRFLLIRKD
jgi:small subunit ribosomal protein S6